MKKKRLYFAYLSIAFTLFIMLVMCCCSRQSELSYVGKTRDDIILESIKWKGQLVPGKITIGTSMSYYHFDAPIDIYADKYLMGADVWRINYYTSKGFFDKLCSYEIVFNNNIVILQRIICSSDAI